MKKVLQDLNFSEVEALVLGMGEKKFRAKQLFEGLTQGKKISDVTSLSESRKSFIPRTARKNISFPSRTEI